MAKDKALFVRTFKNFNPTEKGEIGMVKRYLFAIKSKPPFGWNELQPIVLERNEERAGEMIPGTELFVIAVFEPEHTPIIEIIWMPGTISTGDTSTGNGYESIGDTFLWMLRELYFSEKRHVFHQGTMMERAMAATKIEGHSWHIKAAKELQELIRRLDRAVVRFGAAGAFSVQIEALFEHALIALRKQDC